MSKNKIPLQIIAISDLRLKKTLTSINRTLKALNASSAMLLTSKVDSFDFSCKDYSQIELVKIKPINSHDDYNYFVIYDLYKYIKEDKCLIVQWDGSVMCKWMWSDSFLLYDYIGAPFIPVKKDPSYCVDKHGVFQNVGNGGFSLRSKKLLEAPTKLGLKDDKDFTNAHEDGFFSVLHIETLQSQGYLWAPVNVARRFSQEKPRNFLDFLRPSFGFHGKIYSIPAKFWFFASTILDFFSSKFKKY